MNHTDHPCFSDGARHRVGRIHLPVAPKCNMQCNYCNRDFACVNESRPGVSSAVLNPMQAADYLDMVLGKVSDIKVVGIAGPGDPFANADETIETLRLVRSRHPEMLLCLATNGLELAVYIDDIAELGLSHVTVTVNAVDPTIGAAIYAWARRDRRIYRGKEAAAVILASQMEGIRKLKEKGMTVKVNTVIIPGVNQDHIAEIARHMSRIGVDVMNCIPLYHVAGTPFENIEPLSAKKIQSIRGEAGAYVPQMTHCARCRADAAGMIGEPRLEEIDELMNEALKSCVTAQRPNVAVASMEGIFVNQHLGEASSLWIFGFTDGKVELLHRRSTPVPGGGAERWKELASSITDCGTILVSGIGSFPQITLERAGIRVVVMEGLAVEAVEAVLTGKEIPRVFLRTPGRCGIGQQCRGSGTGCG